MRAGKSIKKLKKTTLLFLTFSTMRKKYEKSIFTHKLFWVTNFTKDKLLWWWMSGWMSFKTLSD